MKNNGEPKGTDFLFSKPIPTCNPEQTTVRSGEARQESQASGDSIEEDLQKNIKNFIEKQARKKEFRLAGWNKKYFTEEEKKQAEKNRNICKNR